MSPGPKTAGSLGLKPVTSEPGRVNVGGLLPELQNLTWV